MLNILIVFKEITQQKVIYYSYITCKKLNLKPYPQLTPPCISFLEKHTTTSSASLPPRTIGGEGDSIHPTTTARVFPRSAKSN